MAQILLAIIFLASVVFYGIGVKQGYDKGYEVGMAKGSEIHTSYADIPSSWSDGVRIEVRDTASITDPRLKKFFRENVPGRNHWEPKK